MISTVTLVCEVQYWLSNASIDVEIMWYRSTSEQTAGIEGERLFSAFSTTSPSMNNDTNTNLQSFLLIMNFGISDIGYYWCQMVVNNETLPPSPYGYIYSNQCVLQDVTCNMANQLLCAHTSTSRQMAHTMLNGQNCTFEDYDAFTLSKISIATTSTSFTMPVIVQTDIVNTNHDYFSLDKISTTYASFTVPVIVQTDIVNTHKTLQGVRCDFTKDGYPCAVGATIAAIVTAVSLLLLILSLLFCLKNRKKKGI